MSSFVEVHTVSFLADLTILNTMLAWTRQMIRKTPLSETEMRKVEIALEEAFVNISCYAYKEAEGNIEIVCRIHPKAFIEFTIKDEGIPFNPLLHYAKGRLNTDIQEREEGGLGIFLMRSLMDEMRYERIKSYNVLTLRKKL